MSKIKYKMQIFVSGSQQIRINSEVEMLVPGVFPGGKSDWKTDKWNENSRSTKLIQAIGDAQKLGFVTVFNTQNQFWQRRFIDKEQIEMVMIKVIGDGFSKIVHLFEVDVVLPSLFPYVINTYAFYFGYTLKFNDSDIDQNWSLSN